MLGQRLRARERGLLISRPVDLNNVCFKRSTGFASSPSPDTQPDRDNAPLALWGFFIAADVQ